jgi:Outer membrane protein beta-barrel domain
MRNPLSYWTTKSALFLGVSLAATGIAPAQATVVGQRGAEITPFVQTTVLMPDWGQTNNIGFTGGVDYTHFIRSIVQPSLELRVTNATGITVGERTYSGGIKLQAAIRKVHPYGVFLVGAGVISFVHPTMTSNGLYSSDESNVYTMGGGAAFDVLSQWQVRGEFTEQHWDIQPQILTPKTFSVGIAYRIPFHNGSIR